MSHNNHNANDHLDDHEDPDGWATWAIGIGGAVLTLATIVFSAGIYYRSLMSEAAVKQIDVTFEQRDMIKDAQQAVLEESSHWVKHHDPATGEVSDRLVIPVDTAMDIVAGNLK